MKKRIDLVISENSDERIEKFRENLHSLKRVFLTLLVNPSSEDFIKNLYQIGIHIDLSFNNLHSKKYAPFWPEDLKEDDIEKSYIYYLSLSFSDITVNDVHALIQIKGFFIVSDYGEQQEVRKEIIVSKIYENSHCCNSYEERKEKEFITSLKKYPLLTISTEKENLLKDFLLNSFDNFVRDFLVFVSDLETLKTIKEYWEIVRNQTIQDNLKNLADSLVPEDSE